MGLENRPYGMTLNSYHKHLPTVADRAISATPSLIASLLSIATPYWNLICGIICF